jgi:transitional endoplasmic reticulum ATPase
MRDLRVPEWLLPALERYHAGASHLFLLTGNVRDVHPFGVDHFPLADGLRRLVGRRAIVASYDISSGLTFPDTARQRAFRGALGLRTGASPSDPARVLLLLDALLSSDRAAPDSVALVFDYAHTLVPSGPSSAVERQAVTTLARWATDPAIAHRRPIVFLLAPSTGEIADEVYAGSAGAEVVAVPRPDLQARTRYLEWLLLSTRGRVDFDTAELARETGGLALVQIEDILQRAMGGSQALDRSLVMTRKIELLRQEYSDVLEIIEPRFGLEAVGGLEHAVTELREVAALLRKGQTSAAPMGVALMGPPGTGKSYLAECFARECGLLCVRFRPLRQMYVGQSERNQERAFAAIRALAPVIVIVDESDQAEGGSRDQGSGDSGVGERMRAAAFNFWGDGSLRGKVLRIDITNRIDLVDSAMRRSGRTDVKIPILMPDLDARAQIFAVSVRKHRLACSIKDFRPYAERTDGFTGSDIELVLTTAWRFVLRDQGTVLDEKALAAALDDLLPQARDQRTIDSMTLLALDECRNRRLLPRNHEEIRRAIAARRAQS